MMQNQIPLLDSTFFLYFAKFRYLAFSFTQEIPFANYNQLCMLELRFTATLIVNISSRSLYLLCLQDFSKPIVPSSGISLIL